MNQYILSQAASRDLEDIIDYLSAKDIDIGEQFLAEFNQKCRNLVRFPNIGRRYEHLSPRLRGLLIHVSLEHFEDQCLLKEILEACLNSLRSLDDPTYF